MTIFTCTRQAFIRKAFCGFSAYRADLVEFMFDFWDCFSVYFGMTRNTNSNSVINVKHQLWVICNFFYVVCVDCYISSTALLAGVIVSRINSLTPLLYATARHGADISKGFSAFPVWGRFSGSGFSGATMGAKTRITTATSPAKLLTANGTNHVGGYRFHGKVFAFTGTIFSPKKISKWFYGKGLSTLFAIDCIHNNILPYFYLFASLFQSPSLQGLRRN
jgi:hypothetical protein